MRINTCILHARLRCSCLFRVEQDGLYYILFVYPSLGVRIPEASKQLVYTTTLWIHSYVRSLDV